LNETETSRIFRCFDPLDAGRNLDTYRSQRPRTRDELFSYSHLILGHFTSTAFLPSILANGLLPNYEHERIMDDTLPSDHESVYLCAHYDRFYIKRVVEHYGGSGIAIVVSVPIAALAPDECALSPVELEKHHWKFSFSFRSASESASIRELFRRAVSWAFSTLTGTNSNES